MLYTPNPASAGWLENGWFVLVLLFATTLGHAFISALRLLGGSAGNASWSGPLPVSLKWFISATTGLALVTQGLFLLGLLGALTGPAVLIACVSLWVTCLGLARYATLRRPPSIRQRVSLGECLSPLLLMLVVGTYLIAWSSGAPGNWDDTSFHLPLARFFLETESLGVNPWLRFPLFPANANLLFAVSLLAGGETFAQVLANAVPLSLTILGIYGLTEHFTKSRWFALLAVAGFCLLEPLYETLGYAYIDHLFSLYGWAFMVCVVLLRHERPADTCLPAAALVCGLLAGTAIGTKLFGAIFVGLMSLALIHRLGWKSRSTLVYIASATLFGVGWYVRSFVISGDPIHPAGGNFFGHYLWSATDMQLQRLDLDVQGVTRDPRLWFVSMMDAKVLTCALGLLVVFQPTARRAGLLPLAITLLAYLLIWQQLFPLGRYLMPMFPAAAFLGAYFLYVLVPQGWWNALQQSKAWQYVNCALPILLLAGGAAFVIPESITLFQTKISQWQATLNGRDGYELFRHASQTKLSANERILHVGFENAIYFYDGETMGDWFGPGRYSQFTKPNTHRPPYLAEILEPQDLLNAMEPFHVRRLAINAKRFTFNPKKYEALFHVETVTPTAFLLTPRTSSESGR
ncbi:hypothetical protein G7048_00495 [Diaphorobacter sp. HDW4B]|uniref:hypothetical protein n=1 Tax=Diaphorobacter sp. HDW4B TaxID=2714925 RepID=UPI00140D2BFA|nr:hypothetical protein [Diaphorobacter sp. HDW4B]QIL69002.1 hypothetical protein G7048_00495 [Diaphorobacter sp. HDW4B]